MRLARVGYTGDKTGSTQPKMWMSAARRGASSVGKKKFHVTGHLVGTKTWE